MYAVYSSSLSVKTDIMLSVRLKFIVTASVR